jgi:hypothetical protein
MVAAQRSPSRRRSVSDTAGRSAPASSDSGAMLSAGSMVNLRPGRAVDSRSRAIASSGGQAQGEARAGDVDADAKFIVETRVTENASSISVVPRSSG